MKTTIGLLRGSALIVLLGTLLVGRAHGQIFVTNLGSGAIGKYDYNTGAIVNASFLSGSIPTGVAVSGANLFIANNGSGTVSEYNYTTGATVNASLVSGLSNPDGIAISGVNLYVLNHTSGTVGVYNATTGATVNASLVSGLNQPVGIAVSGGFIYVTNNANTIAKYNATSGATVNASLVSGLSNPGGIAVSGTNLYVANGGGTIGEYTTSGATVNASLVSGLSNPTGIAVVSGSLFVVNNGNNTIGEYDATTGATVNASLVSGLNHPFLIAAVATPQEFSLRTVSLNSNAWATVNINQALNKIYVSGNGSSNCDVEVNVIDGNTFAIKDVGYGTTVSVDNKTNTYWAATIYGSSGASFGCPSPPPYPAGVIIRDGTTDDVISTVNLGPCPVGTTYDFFKDRMWVGAQCGAGNDPVYAIDANKFQVIPGTPKGSNGVMGPLIANGANGVLYLQASGVSERVNPTTFAVTQNAFGTVEAINPITNKLYAVSGNNLQIINGGTNPETILSTVALGYSPGSMGINTALNRLYIANPAGNSIEIRDPSTGALTNTFALSAYGVTPSGAMAVDSTRSRICVIQNATNTSGALLLVLEDLTNATLKANCVVSPAH